MLLLGAISDGEKLPGPLDFFPLVMPCDKTRSVCLNLSFSFPAPGLFFLKLFFFHKHFLSKHCGALPYTPAMAVFQPGDFRGIKHADNIINVILLQKA